MPDALWWRLQRSSPQHVPTDEPASDENRVIASFCQAITQPMDLDALLDRIADATLEQCGADEVSIMLPAPGGHDLRVVTVRGGQREGILGQRVPLGHGIAGRVAVRREHV